MTCYFVLLNTLIVLRPARSRHYTTTIERFHLPLIRSSESKQWLRAGTRGKSHALCGATWGTFRCQRHRMSTVNGTSHLYWCLCQ